jgi:DNA-binding NtrC family response regulator
LRTQPIQDLPTRTKKHGGVFLAPVTPYFDARRSGLPSAVQRAKALLRDHGTRRNDESGQLAYRSALFAGIGHYVEALEDLLRYVNGGLDLELQELARVVRSLHARNRAVGNVRSSGDAPPESATLKQIERWAILRAIDWAQGNQARAAARLGISPRTLHYKLRKTHRMRI